MKKIFLITVLFFGVYLLPSCKKSSGIQKEAKEDIDLTVTCKVGNESGAYTLFFKPPVGWFGDPFPYYANGSFYIYYLQDWRGIQPYLHPFHLATTEDAATFTYNGEVLPVGKNDAQDASLCTGSIIKSNENDFYYMFYAGHKFNNNPETPLQAVMLAVSKDLKNWTKDPTFSLSINAEGYNRNDFRDPFVYYDDEAGLYKMLVTTQRNGQGTLALFTSNDLYHWEYQSPFYVQSDTPILECADVFKEGDWWYLIYSNVRDRKVHYRYSSSQNGPWITPEHSALDGIAYYAGKTASDGDNRYVFGWCPTRIGDGAEDQWGGAMVTHKLVSQADGTLKVVLPSSVENKLNRKIETPVIKEKGNTVKNGEDHTLQEGSKTTFPRINAASKIVSTIKAAEGSDIFGFVFGDCEEGEEKYYIAFDLADKKLKMYKENGGTRELQTEVYLPVPTSLTFDVKIVAEKSVCVVYVNNEIAFTNRLNKMNENPWGVFSEKGSIQYIGLQVYR